MLALRGQATLDNSCHVPTLVEGLLLNAGADMQSEQFIALVDRKLAEVSASPLAGHHPYFGMTDGQRLALLDAVRTDLARVVRLTETSFELDALVARYDELWMKTIRTR